MARQVSAQIRRALYQVHLWIAVVLCILLVPIGLTGSLIAWPEQVQAVLHPPPHVAATETATLSPSAYLEAAKAGLPKGARVLGLRMPAKPGEAVAVSATLGRGGPAAGQTAWLDPADGKVLSAGRTIPRAYQMMHQFHDTLLLEENGGGAIVGWAGVAMFILSLSGIWLWWPRGNSFLRAFRWRRTPGTLMNLHYLVGFWVSIPLALLSITGVFISFPKVGAAVLGAPPPQAQAPRPPGGGGPREPTLTAEQAIAAARAAHPEAPRLVAVNLPGAGGRGPAGTQNAWRVELAGSGRPVALRVDDRSSAVSDAPPAGPPPPQNAVGFSRALHEAHFGLFWKWIVTLVGFVPALLAVTGVITWIKAEQRKARMRQGGVETEEAQAAEA